jgi:hypothetical protein
VLVVVPAGAGDGGVRDRSGPGEPAPAGPAPGLQALLHAYPDALLGAAGNELVWKDGTVMVFDDGVPDKPFQVALERPDLEDQVSMPYPRGAAPPEAGRDPGRVRYEPFFLKMYGSTPGQVEENLAAVRWTPAGPEVRLPVTRVNGVHLRLQRVSEELDRLPAGLKKYVDRPAGTYAWRYIEGTRRLSPHSFGIAIDINLAYADYWRWHAVDPLDDLTYRNRVPLRIVELFEEQGFIWGGRWHHYDTMHFEYRPELLP